MSGITGGGQGVLAIANVLVGFLIAAAMAYVAAVSRFEGEKRALLVASSVGLLLPLPYLTVGLLHFPYRGAVAVGLLTVTAVAAVLLLLPIRGASRVEGDTPRASIDERDIMFSRRLLEPGTARFDEYYARRPEKRPLDDEFRKRPGLLAPRASAYHPLAFRAADASFWTIEQLRPFVEGEPVGELVRSDPAAITRFLKRWTVKLGAVSVGITRLQDYHKYSVIGRGAQYGEQVVLDHAFALALTVEMDKGMIDRAPLGPTVMESAQQYVAAGVIAVQLSEFIRRLGYSARAHVDGNYRVVCPLVARDAGLGELGRMGLLMTPRLGPRVRIAVVTTDLPLIPDERNRDDTVVDFCSRCDKCASACPSGAIPLGDRAEIDGALRWRIDQEACFIFWSQIGTDCARCVRACPFSHPDNTMHNLIRWGVRNSVLFRRCAIWMDDLFYGDTPTPAKLPDWMER